MDASRPRLPRLRDAGRMLLVAAKAFRHLSWPLLRWLARLPEDPRALGVRLRTLFEDLGVMYIKLGQFMASRFDLLPREVCDELSLLFERAPPFTFDQVRTRLEAELGMPVERVFAAIDPAPVGSASVAQVHRGLTLDGRDVAIKVQRPGVREVFDADVRNLARMAHLVDWLGLTPGYQFGDLVDEFGAFTAREMDFVLEAGTMERVRREQAHSGIHICSVHWQLTTPRLLVMDFFEGVSYATVLALLDVGREDEVQKLLPGVSLRAVLETLTRATLSQIFLAGFFQADPHPGNILIGADGTVALVDFGIFGSLTPRKRRHVLGYIENLVFGDIDEAYRHYSQLLIFTTASDGDAFKREAKDVLRRYHRASTDLTTTPEERHVARFGDELGRLLYRHRVRLELDTFLFWRALFVLDATFVRPTEGFDLQIAMESFFREAQPNPAQRVLDVALDTDRWEETRGILESVPRLRGVAVEARVSRMAPSAGARANRAAKDAALVSLACASVALAASWGAAAILLAAALLGAGAVIDRRGVRT